MTCLFKGLSKTSPSTSDCGNSQLLKRKPAQTNLLSDFLFVQHPQRKALISFPRHGHQPSLFHYLCPPETNTDHHSWSENPCLLLTRFPELLALIQPLNSIQNSEATHESPEWDAGFPFLLELLRVPAPPPFHSSSSFSLAPHIFLFFLAFPSFHSSFPSLPFSLPLTNAGTELQAYPMFSILQGLSSRGKVEVGPSGSFLLSPAKCHIAFHLLLTNSRLKE